MPGSGSDDGSALARLRARACGPFVPKPGAGVDIQCCCITAISELLTDEDRAAIRRAFGIPPVSGFVCTEGLAGHTQPGDAVLRFATDICIIELASSLR